MIEREYDFRAEFYDVDSMGVMWHGNYVKYCEMARCRLLDEVGCNYLDVQNANFALPIVKMDFKYISPLYFNDDFKVAIKILSYDIFLELQYTFFKDIKKLALAHTKQVAVSFKGRNFNASNAQPETYFELPPMLKERIARLDSHT